MRSPATICPPARCAAVERDLAQRSSVTSTTPGMPGLSAKGRQLEVVLTEHAAPFDVQVANRRHALDGVQLEHGHRAVGLSNQHDEVQDADLGRLDHLGQGRPDRSQCVLAGYNYDQVLDQICPDLVPAVSTLRFLSNGRYGSSVGSLPSDSGSKPSSAAPPQSVWSEILRTRRHRLDKVVRLSLERCEGGAAGRQHAGLST